MNPIQYQWPAKDCGWRQRRCHRGRARRGRGAPTIATWRILSSRSVASSSSSVNSSSSWCNLSPRIGCLAPLKPPLQEMGPVGLLCLTSYLGTGHTTKASHRWFTFPFVFAQQLLARLLTRWVTSHLYLLLALSSMQDEFLHTRLSLRSDLSLVEQDLEFLSDVSSSHHHDDQGLVFLLHVRV